MKTKEKKFDAVKMMRDIRDKLHEEYERNPEKRKADLGIFQSLKSNPKCLRYMQNLYA